MAINTNSRLLRYFLRRRVAIFLLFGTITIALGCLEASSILHEGMIARTFRLPMSHFDTTPIGRIVNRFAKDVDVVDNLIPSSIRTALLCFLSVCWEKNAV